MKRKVAIVPCSGIGKSFGSVAREGAYTVTEELCPDKTRLVPLALLVLGDEGARSALAQTEAITIDGCKLACAAKVASEVGGKVAHKLQVLDVFRRRHNLKPSGIAELDENGKKLARILADEIKELVEGMQGGADRA
jgi:uncharacterized metal-binding protein